YSEGEEERVLRAVQVVVDEELAKPILIGRPEVINARIDKFGLRIRPGVDFELININDDPRYRATWQRYQQLMGRRGITPEAASASRPRLRCCRTLISAAPIRHRRARCVRRGGYWSSGTRNWSSMARCTGTLRCRRRFVPLSTRSPLSRGRQTC